MPRHFAVGSDGSSRGCAAREADGVFDTSYLDPTTPVPIPVVWDQDVAPIPSRDDRTVAIFLVLGALGAMLAIALSSLLEGL